MKVIKEIGNGMIAFLLCLALFGTFVIFLISNTVLNQEYILKQLQNNDFYGRMETDLKNGFEEYQYQSGFSREVFEGLFTKEMVKQDVNSVVAYLYEGTGITNHTEAVRKRIRENMNQYLNQNQITLTEKQLENIDDFEEIIVNVYESKINMVPKYLDKIAKGREKVEQVVVIVQKLCVGTLLTVLMVAIGINLKSLTGFCKTIGISLLASGILLVLMRFVIVKNIDIKNILLFSQFFSDLMKEVLYNMLLKINQFGVLGMMIGLILIIVANNKKIRE